MTASDVDPAVEPATTEFRLSPTASLATTARES